MSKKEFLDLLKSYLEGFGQEEKKDILYDYEEHFRIGQENGKSEDEIAKELGSPIDIANQYREANGMDKVNVYGSQKSVGGSIVTFIGLLMFNFIFVLWIYIGVISAVLGVCIGAFAVTVSGLALVFASVFGGWFIPYIQTPDILSRVAVFFGGIGTLALGLLMCIAMFYVVKIAIVLTVKYIKWNIKLIKG
ncbi:membrane protein [Clostridium acetobutylicum]|nr:membrane protein [Clostridium acetobutylicum]